MTSDAILTELRSLPGAPEGLRERVRADGRHEAGGRGDLHARFLVEEVKPFVDREYRTLPGRACTAIAGSSMGGLASLTTAWQYPRVFGMAGVVSPSLWWGRGRALEELREDASWMRRTRFWLCMGTRRGTSAATSRRTSSGLAPPRRATPMSRVWCPDAITCTGRSAGGEHNEAAWSARFDKMLLYFFGV